MLVKGTQASLCYSSFAHLSNVDSGIQGTVRDVNSKPRADGWMVRVHL